MGLPNIGFLVSLASWLAAESFSLKSAFALPLQFHVLRLQNIYFLHLLNQIEDLLVISILKDLVMLLFPTTCYTALSAFRPKKNLFSTKRTLIMVILPYLAVGLWGTCHLKIIFFETVKSVFKYSLRIADIAVSQESVSKFHLKFQPFI